MINSNINEKKMKTALLTGTTGQDGAYLSQLLLNKGYQVHGVKRRASSFNTDRIDHLYQDPHEEGIHFVLHYGDLTDSTNLIRIIQEVQPDEIYNLGAQSHVQVSFETPEYTANSDAMGTLRILEALRILGMDGRTRFYQASTSELYGLVQEVPQRETTPFYPRSPYAAAKLYAYWITVNYRESYGIHASNGILFNHESPLRGETFVTRKITRAVARILLGLQNRLYLGNMDALRDWGFAGDYVEAMWRILQQDEPGDYVIATGEMHTVREFVDAAFLRVGISLEWRGSGVSEVGVVASVDATVADAAHAPFASADLNDAGRIRRGDTVVAVDPRYFRPAEVEQLLGDPSRARDRLGWEPKVKFQELVEMMVDADLADQQRELYLKHGGYEVKNYFE